MSGTRQNSSVLVLIGALKLASGLLMFAAGIGLFRLFRGDVDEALETIVTRLHLDPDNRLIQSIISGVLGVSRKQLRLLEAGTFFYATLHSIEGIGLILRRRWAEYLVVVATGSLIPFEIYEIYRKTTALRLGVFAVNVVILVYLIVRLRRDRQRADVDQAGATSEPHGA